MISAVSRPEFIADISFSANTEQMMPTNGGQIPNDRFIDSLMLEFEGRMTNPGSGNPTGTQADAPFSLIEQITVTGYHRATKARGDFIQVRGAEMRELTRLYTVRAPLIVPASLSVTASATNDIRFFMLLPFAPLGLPIRQRTQFLLDAPNWDQLQLKVRFSDALSVFTGQTTQPTFTAFGATTGSPRLRVSGIFALDNRQFSGFVPARVWRYFAENVSGDIVGGATASRQYNIPRGYRVRNILVKTGVKSAAVTAGNNAYNSLSNTIFANVQIHRGLNRVIRRYIDYFVVQEEFGNYYGISPSTGYALLDFVKSGAQFEALDLANAVAGPSGDTDVFLQADVTGASAQGALFLIEELRGQPRQMVPKRIASGVSRR